MAAGDITNIFTGRSVDIGGLPDDRVPSWSELDGRAEHTDATHLGGVIVTDSGVFVLAGLANALSKIFVNGITRDLPEPPPGESK